MVFIAEPQVASLTDLRHYFGTPGNPVSVKEILELMESLTTEEKRALRRDPAIPHLNYWDLLDAEEWKEVDDE